MVARHPRMPIEGLAERGFAGEQLEAIRAASSSCGYFRPAL